MVATASSAASTLVVNDNHKNDPKLDVSPNANAWLVGDTVLEFAAVNVALAVDASGGVIAPVLRDAGALDLAQLAERRADLVSRAREGRVTEHDLSGGTLTVSNVAGLGAHAITPVLTPPQAVALGLGSARAADDGRTLTATLVGDHRLLDGADGARFLRAERSSFLRTLIISYSLRS